MSRGGHRRAHALVRAMASCSNPAISANAGARCTWFFVIVRLNAMAEAWAAQQAQPNLNSLSFDERFGLLVDAEWLARENARLGRAMKEAKLRMSSACVEDIEYQRLHQLTQPRTQTLA